MTASGVRLVTSVPVILLAHLFTPSLNGRENGVADLLPVNRQLHCRAAVDEIDGTLDAGEELGLTATSRKPALLQHRLQVRHKHTLQLRAPQGLGKGSAIRAL